jgi:hypothetical protein
MIDHECTCTGVVDPCPGCVKNRLEAIRARAKAATRGPWNCYTGETDHRYVQQRSWRGDNKSSAVSVCSINGPCIMVPNPQPQANQEFIAHAREDVPWLLEQLRRQKAIDSACEDITTDFLEIMAKQGGLRAMIEKTSPYYRELRDEVEKLRALLERTYDATEHCVFCGAANPKPYGHKPGCELAAAIGEQP